MLGGGAAGGGPLERLEHTGHGVAYPYTRVNEQKPQKVLFGCISTSRSARGRRPWAVQVPAGTCGSGAR